MPISNVSFGSVVAVSGRPKKISTINQRLRNQASNGKVIMKNVTPQYVNASSDGLIAQAAQRGDRVEIYITGEEAEQVRKKAPEFSTIDGILSHMSSYIDVNTCSIGDVINKIFEH